jgi:hypothetical protein
VSIADDERIPRRTPQVADRLQWQAAREVHRHDPVCIAMARSV